MVSEGKTPDKNCKISSEVFFKKNSGPKNIIQHTVNSTSAQLIGIECYSKFLEFIFTLTMIYQRQLDFQFRFTLATYLKKT